MNRDQRIQKQGEVSEQWLALYDDVPGFDPDNPTLEQSNEQYRLERDAFGTVGQGEFADAVAKLDAGQLAALRRLPMYDPTFLPEL